MQFAGTEQLAALGPTSLIFNFSSYVFNALGIATNSVVSTHLAQQDLAGANDTATSALLFAIACGFAVLLLLQVQEPCLPAAWGPKCLNAVLPCLTCSQHPQCRLVWLAVNITGPDEVACFIARLRASPPRALVRLRDVASDAL